MPSFRIAAAAAGAIALGIAAPVAQAQDTTVTAVGSATAVPKPADRHSESSIDNAVEAAQADALPRAVAEARDYARKLARAAGFKLGDLVSISNSANAAQPYYVFGPFGVGQFCNRQPSFKTVVGANGVRHGVRLKGTRLVCRVPPRVSTSVSMTFKLGR